jgi:hypothetical protein
LSSKGTIVDQTPAHEQHNPDLLALIPKDAKKLIEVGCSYGALAREYKKINSHCRYLGVEVVLEYAERAKRHCDAVFTLDIEEVDETRLQGDLASDCWIFGDSLEHLKDPWRLLGKIRKALPEHGSVVACIPNIQYWGIQAHLNCGDFRYKDSGPLDRTHLRWFTRTTILEMFTDAGFAIAAIGARIFDEPEREKVLPAIKYMASLIGANPEQAVNDALPVQYVMRAVPK